MKDNMHRLPKTRTTLLALFLINFLNFFDRVIPAVVLEPIRKEFLLNDTMLGLMATGFILVYAVAGVPLGVLADRVRRTRLLAAGVFVWSLLTTLTGVVTGIVPLFLTRIGVGVGEAACAPAANSMIGDLYPAEKRSRAMGLFMLGLPLGTLIAYAVVGWLEQRYGWRFPFLLAGVPGFLLALVMLLIPEPVRGIQEANKTEAVPNEAYSLRKLLSIRTLWWITISGAFFNFASYALGAFLPALMTRYHHATVAQAGLVGAIVFGVTGLLGLTFGAQIADRIYRAFPNGRLKYGALCLLLSAPLLWLGLGQPQGQIILVTVFLSIGWLLWFNYYVAVYPAIQDVVEPRLRATAMSLYFFFQYILGAGFGTLVTGMISDRYAAHLMRTTGAAVVSDSMRALGLQHALISVVPLSVLLTGIAVAFAARHFVADAEKVSGMQRHAEKLPA